jgi:hypothetical protein
MVGAHRQKAIYRQGEIAVRRHRGSRDAPRCRPLGLRWPVERTNSWLSNYGQLRRNTDPKVVHHLAQVALVVTLLVVAKLIDRQQSTSAAVAPIR